MTKQELNLVKLAARQNGRAERMYFEGRSAITRE
jgi:hypothetical protein